MIRIVLLSFFLLVSCAPGTQISPQTQVVGVYATSAAQPWQPELYACANQLSVLLKMTPESPDIYLRVGEPETLVSPAYQIDEEKILIVTHRESPVQDLSLPEAQDLFAGKGDPAVQVWVYASGEDLQIAFDQLVMKGRSVSSFARLATSPQQMSDVLNSDVNSVGILSGHWKMGTVRDLYSAGTVPVLAITRAEPTGITQRLVACLQK